MNLVPVYVRATNRLFYQDPVIIDTKNNWYILFSDHNHPELVMSQELVKNKRRAQSCAREILLRLNLEFSIVGLVAANQGRLFFHTTNSVIVKEACVVRFILKSCIPVPTSFVCAVVNIDRDSCCVVVDKQEHTDDLPQLRGEITSSRE